MSITELGKVMEWSGGRFLNSSIVMPWLSRNRAKSPTTLLDGVTFTMSPKAKFTSAYMRATSGQRSPKPMASACSFRLVNWPPGISWMYTSALPDLGALSNGV